MKTYLCTWCWKEFPVTSVLNRMMHDNCACWPSNGVPDPRKELRNAQVEIDQLKCKLNNLKPMCCKDTPCACQKQCDPCSPPDPKHFVGDLILISGWKVRNFNSWDFYWSEHKQVEQITIVEAKYIDGEWRYYDKKGGDCVVTDCHILKNYSYQEPEQKKLGRPKKHK